jgi:hypothetical protein
LHGEIFSIWLAIKTGIKNMLYNLRAVMYHHDKLVRTEWINMPIIEKKLIFQTAYKFANEKEQPLSAYSN